MLINVNKKGYILYLTINRPEVRNALSEASLIELKNILLSIDKDIRCLVITGEGDKSFCAGADLKERQNMSEMQTLSFINLINEAFNLLAKLSIPSIAMINGDAFGGGLELALCCDFRVAQTKSLLGLTEVSLGIIPGAGGTQRLPRLIGLYKALDMILLAKKISAKEALDISLINYLCEKEELLAFTSELAIKLSSNAPLAIKAAKQAIFDGYEKKLLLGLSIENNAYKNILFTHDRKEGLSSFAQKRPPNFIGK